MSEHVHDCTGANATCPCGYVFSVPPICVSIEIYNRNSELVSQQFNCDNLRLAIKALRDAAYKLEQIA